MFSPARLLTLSALSVACSAALVYPAFQGVPDSVNDASGLTSNIVSTDADSISSTITSVDQKGRVTDASVQDDTPSETTVVAIDGKILSGGDDTSHLARRAPIATGSLRRSANEYVKVFNGTGVDAAARDASVVGTSYLTYTAVSGDKYDVEPCLAFCDNVEGCAFVNLYYEVKGNQSTLKCAAFGDVHAEEEKTYQGEDGSFVQQSTGWALKDFGVDAAAPEGYELVFGPSNAANNAPHYMGFVLLDRYDINKCAQECNKRAADSSGGACKYFNIWRAVVNKRPQSYTCSLYYIPTNSTTATNYGQGDLAVTLSRGFRRVSFVPDGDFESYKCSGGGAFCWTNVTSNWIGESPVGGNFDATIFHYSFYAYHGTGVGLLGSAVGADPYAGRLSPARPLLTKAGKKVVVGWFAGSTYSGPALEKDAFFTLVWNGRPVQTFKTGYSPWKYYEVVVDATGYDKLSFVGGKAPSYTFIDEVYAFYL